VAHKQVISCVHAFPTSKDSFGNINIFLPFTVLLNGAPNPSHVTCHKSEERDCPRSSVRFRLNPENSNSHGFELHRPSIKGTKPLLKVLKAIIIILGLFSTEACGRPDTVRHVIGPATLRTWGLWLLVLNFAQARGTALGREYEFHLGAKWRPRLDYPRALWRQPPKLVPICQ